MKVHEILSLAPVFLKRLHEFGIKNDAYQWLTLYKEYVNMKNSGEKVVYIVASLSTKYNVCERKVYKIVREMERDCHFHTAE